MVKKIYKRKVQKFKKVQTLINAVSTMQGIRAEVKKELKSNAPIIAKIGAIKAKKQDYQTEENKHKSRTLNMAWIDYMQIKEDKKLLAQTLKSYRIHYSTHIKDVIGENLLHTITTEQIQDIINNTLKMARKPRTAQTTQQILRPLFNRELQTKGTLLKINPVLNTVIPRFNNEKTIDISDEQAKLA